MELPITSLQTTVYVREHLNQDEVERLAQLITEGQSIAPILVAKIDGSDKYDVIDGRTRLAAYKQLQFEVIPVVLSRTVKDTKTIILEGCRANENRGPRPLNKRDIQITVRRLREAGATVNEIKQMFPQYKRFILEAINWAESNAKQKTVTTAVGLVRDGGFTVKDAAKKMNVTEDAIKTQLQRGVRISEPLHIAGLFSNANLSYGKKTAGAYRMLDDAIMENTIKLSTGLHLLERQRKHAQKLVAQADDRIARFYATHQDKRVA